MHCVRRFNLIISLGLLLLPAAASAQFAPEKFVSSHGEALPYELFYPALSGTARYPLVVYLHGAGSRGSDNRGQIDLTPELLNRFVDPAQQAATPAFVLAPQCGTHEQWVNCDWKVGNYSLDTVPESRALSAVIELIRSLSLEKRIDTSQIYICGLSMGGFGVWDALTRHPDLFKAAIVVCGGGDTSRAAVAADIPIWVFHGRFDPQVPVQASRDIVSKLASMNGRVFYTEYPFVYHDAWVSASKEPDLTNWFFSRSGFRDRLLTPDQPSDWYDLLGRKRFHGTRNEIKRLQLVGVFLSRTDKIVKIWE